MSRARTHKTVATLLLAAGCLASPTLSTAASPIQLSGVITGIVSSAGGVPQLGATVLLLNRQERIFRKVLTDERGEFRFPGLMPDLYSIKVSLAAYVPALKRDISV